jgi:hypothetical protein
MHPNQLPDRFGLTPCPYTSPMSFARLSSHVTVLLALAPQSSSAAQRKRTAGRIIGSRKLRTRGMGGTLP